MKKMLLSALLAVVALGAASPASAQARVDARRARQQERINAGMQRGQLNPNEAARLERGQARVNRAEARAEADGVVTPREQRRLERMQNRESRRIERMRHNNR